MASGIGRASRPVSGESVLRARKCAPFPLYFAQLAGCPCGTNRRSRRRIHRDAMVDALDRRQGKRTMTTDTIGTSPGFDTAKVAAHYDDLDRIYREIWGEH